MAIICRHRAVNIKNDKTRLPRNVTMHDVVTSRRRLQTNLRGFCTAMDGCHLARSVSIYN